MSELKGIIRTKGNLKGTVNTNVKTKATVSVGGTLISSQTSKRGIPGVDGYSPSASVSKVGNKATITITDKDGTTTADIYDGSGGGASAFIAEYGVTPYADVKDAYDEDAIIICTVDDSGNTVVLQLAYFDDENDTFCFAQPVSEGSYWTSIAVDDTWDDGYFQFASTDTATQLRDGLMSSSDKSKLDNIASGAEVNVQSDWSQSDNTKDDYIKNKPTIPSKTSDLINDSNFLHGNTKGVFYGTCSTAASTAAKEVTISGFASSDRVIGAVVFVMMGHTNTASVSNLTLNVSGTGAKSIKYINNGSLANLPSAGYLETPNVYPFYYDGDYWICMFNSTPAIHNVPSGGSSGQVLAKSSGTDYDVGWVNQSGGSVTDVTQNGTSVVSSGVAAVTVPTDTGDLTNGAGFITTETDPTVPSWAKAVSKPSYTFSEIGSTPSTLSGYGITDAKISSGTITLGSDTITPLTSYTETDPVFTASDAYGISSSDITAWNAKAEVAKAIPFATCSTAALTSPKLVTIPEITSLTTGLIIAVKFSLTNSVADPQLKVNSLDAKPIRRYSSTSPGTSASTSWRAGQVILFAYDGSAWQMVDWTNPDTTYSLMSDADMKAGTSTSSELISAKRLKDAVQYHAPVSDVTLDGTSVVSSGVAALTTPTIHNVPSGGTTNQVLAKNSNTDYDLKWTSAGGGGGTLVQLVRW